MRPLHLFPLILILAALGCYGYVPATTPPDPGERVRAEFNDEGITAVRPVLGAGVGGIDGLLLRADEDTFTMSVALMRTVRGDLSGSGEPVTVRWDQVQQLSTKKLSPVRSVLLGIGIAAAGFLLHESFADEGFVTESDSTEIPGPTERRPGLPLGKLRIPIRIGGG